MTSSTLLALFLLAACNINETKQQIGCKRLIADSQMKTLSGLIDAQMKSSCNLTFYYVDEGELENTVCFLKAAYSPLRSILNNIEFKDSSPNFKTLNQFKNLHSDLEGCIDLHEHEESKDCVKSFSMTAEEMLHLVHNYFGKAKEALSKLTNFKRDCSRVFQKCQHRKETSLAGVVTDQNCSCPGKSPINGRHLASSLPTFEPLSSIADQLDSRETAASTLQLVMLPGTTQTEGALEGSTKPRVPRSTHKGPRTVDGMDVRVGTDAVIALPPEEPSIAAVQGSDPVSMAPASLLDPTVIPHTWSPRLKSIPAFLSTQPHVESMRVESPLLDSEAGSSQTRPIELSSQHPSFSDLAKPSPSKQWLQTRDVDTATPGLASDWDITDASSTSSLILAYFANLKPEDSSGVPSSGRLVTFPPSVPAFISINSDEFVSATQHPSATLVAATGSSSSPGQIFPESYSWEEQGSRGRAPGMQQSTQLRERRAGHEEGLAQDREPEDSMAGPHFDLNFIPPNTDKHVKNPESSGTKGVAVTYVVVPSVLGILLAVGGLLFYLHKSRVLARRRLQRTECNMERKEGMPLNRGEEHLELQLEEL